MEPYSWHNLGLAEVRRLGMGEVTTDEGQKLWFSGEIKECRNGVGFFIHTRQQSAAYYIASTYRAESSASNRMHHPSN